MPKINKKNMLLLFKTYIGKDGKCLKTFKKPDSGLNWFEPDPSSVARQREREREKVLIS